jgi:predicted PurR-regulated permease PerM
MIPPGKPIEQILGIFVLLLFGAGCLIVLRPFLSALIWAAVICFSTWPVHIWLERLLGGRRALSAALMTLLLAIMLVAPLAIVVATLADSANDMVTAATHTLEAGLPLPPRWISELPIFGKGLAAYWQSLAHNSPTYMNALKSLIRPAADFALAAGTRIGAGMLGLGLSIFITYFFYRHGQVIAAFGRQTAERFAGPRARRLLGVAGTTVKGVVYGLIGTALAQAGLAAIGFSIAGVAHIPLLSFLTFVLSFAPIGPPLVWGAVALWFFTQNAIGWGVFIVLWGFLLISSIDNILKPYLIGKTSDLPILLSFFGLFGGVLAFGLIGIFLGPTLLAVGYSLIVEWTTAEIEERRHPTLAPPESR